MELRMSERPYATAPIASTQMPPGIPYIVGNEAAERFSFYGMRCILVIFMTKYLLDSQGDLAVMGEEEAMTYFHLFTAGVYFFPILGAILADALWGKYRTILSLSLVYCLGHLALAADETRLGLFTGLILITLGAGGIKSCVSAHVGDQFGTTNSHLLPKVFGWFYFSINLGSFISTILTPLLCWTGSGPRWAFGVPGVLDGGGHVLLLARALEVRPHPARRKGVCQGNLQPRGVPAVASSSIIYALRGHVLGAVRPDGLEMGACRQSRWTCNLLPDGLAGTVAPTCSRHRSAGARRGLAKYEVPALAASLRQSDPRHAHDSALLLRACIPGRQGGSRDAAAEDIDGPVRGGAGLWDVGDRSKSGLQAGGKPRYIGKYSPTS